jgi:hypothetical protein
VGWAIELHKRLNRGADLGSDKVLIEEELSINSIWLKFVDISGNW